LDARPSDAIALALRFGVPIFSNEQILSKAGIIISDDESIDAEVTEEGEELIEKVSEIINEDSHDFDDCSNEDLQSMLTKSLSDEDYEEAARIRDELNKRTS
jgi:hypothetical protein